MTPGQPGMGKQGLAYRNRTRGAWVGQLGWPSSDQGVQMPCGASGQASPMAPLTSPSRLQMQAEVTMAHLTLPEGTCRKSSPTVRPDFLTTQHRGHRPERPFQAPPHRGRRPPFGRTTPWGSAAGSWGTHREIHGGAARVTAGSSPQET